jgi:hypothetical protein
MSLRPACILALVPLTLALADDRQKAAGALAGVLYLLSVLGIGLILLAGVWAILRQGRRLRRAASKTRKPIVYHDMGLDPLPEPTTDRPTPESEDRSDDRPNR